MPVAMPKLKRLLSKGENRASPRTKFKRFLQNLGASQPCPEGETRAAL